MFRISKTPLRVSLLGGGTDFPDYYDQHGGGACLSMAINHYVRVIVKRRPDNAIRLGYSQSEIAQRLDGLKHELLREALRYASQTAGVLANGLEIVTIGDVPQGTGLGSSSAVTAGTLKALMPAIADGGLAEAAYFVERRMVGKSLGKQDQYAAACGGFNLIEFRPNTTPSLTRVDWEPALEFRQRLLLFRIGGERDAETILVGQKGAIGDRLDELARLKELAVKGFFALHGGLYDDIGRMMHEGWTLKRELAAGITSNRIDLIYQRALDAGALGGKVCGAGGGGYLLVYAPTGLQNRVREALRDCPELPFDVDWVGSRITHEEY